MIQIKRVESKKEFKTFVDFPNQLYKNNPYYVPELVCDGVKVLDRSINPAYAFCEAEFFLAYKDEDVVGRIGVIINNKSNEKWNQNYARFTGFDFVNDLEVSRSLMEVAINWAMEQDVKVLHGPLGFTDLDHQGMMIEGFEELDMYITIYNAPYYMEHMIAMGFEKDVDWIEYQLVFDPVKIEKLHKIAARMKSRGAFNVIEFKSKKELLPWAESVFNLYNTAYAPLYGMTELNQKQIDLYIKTFFGYVNPDFIKIVVDKEGELAAFAIAMPSLSKAMQKSKGRLLPFGFIHILRAIKKNDALDLYLIAVKPEYQNLGINGLLLDSMMKNVMDYGILSAETGPMLETNNNILSQWKFFNIRQHRRRRVWKKTLKG
jgi:GNAT superfamily N-acetyltransferase